MLQLKKRRFAVLVLYKTISCWFFSPLSVFDLWAQLRLASPAGSYSTHLKKILSCSCSKLCEMWCHALVCLENLNKKRKKEEKNVEKTFCGIERAAAFPYTAQCSVIRVLFSSFLSFFLSLSCFACLFLFLSFSINLKTNTAGHVQQKILEATVDKKNK